MQDLDLRDIPYFKEMNAEFVVDSLTQVISRQYIIELTNKLIEENTKFTMMILDIDNFKHVNDAYGHLSGDFILRSIGEGLLAFCCRSAYVGRYGGDEFLLIVPGIIVYEDIHKFLESMYEKGRIFRRIYNDSMNDIFVTATLGCATYPNDGNTFEEVFNKADKALYRGKIKGRNCYIIYVESKHSNIVVREKTESTLIDKYNAVKRLFDAYKNDSKKIKYIVDFLCNELHCTEVCFLTNDHSLISSKHKDVRATSIMYEPHLELLLKGDKFFYDMPLTKYKKNDMEFSAYAASHNIHGLIVAKVGTRTCQYGYFMIYESEIERVWQESEIALVMYATALLEIELINRF